MEKWIRIHNRNAWVGFIAALLAFACVRVSVCICGGVYMRVNMCAAPLRMCEFAVTVFTRGGVGEEV